MAEPAVIATELAAQLTSERHQANALSAWYEGEQAPPESLKDCSEVYKRLRSMARANWAGLVIDAAADRLFVEGFRFGGEDELPWQLWQANDLDADSSSAMLEALITKRCPVMVVADPNSPVGVRITVEDPREVVVAYEPGHRVATAALKQWTVGDDEVHTELMLPGRLIRWQSRPGHDLGTVAAEELDGAAVVPIVELTANARVGRGGRSELAPAVDHLQRIDKLTFDLAVAAEFGAFRQKWVTGMEVPEDADGQPIQPFKAMIDRAMVGESPDIKFGTFDATDLGPYVQVIEAAVNHLAAVTKTPPHYLLSGMTNLSADAIRAAEAALVTRVRRHQRAFGEQWERVMRMALRAVGSELADDPAAETIWRNAETRTDAERADALTKLVQGIGLPKEAAWELWEQSPQTRAEWKRMAAREAFMAPQQPASATLAPVA